jgi:hypothetical protein
MGAKNRKLGDVRSFKGYVIRYMPDHPMAAKNGYVMAHRLIMAEHLNRNLEQHEVVHHRNGIKNDNRIENLELMDKRTHDRLPKPPRVRTADTH